MEFAEDSIMPSLSSAARVILIGEDALDRTLCIVEVAADGYNLDVAPPSCVTICSFCMGDTPSTG